MKYPDFIEKNDVIGVTATSDGNRKEVDFTRLSLAEEKLKKRGYQVKMTENVRTSRKGRSDTAFNRATQLLHLFEEESVKSIVLAKGGDFLMEMLPETDFTKISSHPKWVQGFSDSTGLLFTITTNCDIATIYSNHFNDFAMEPWHKSVCYNMDILEGNIPLQVNFDMYEDDFHDRVTGEEPYWQDKKVCWQGTEDEIEISGRMLGGCLDVLLNLVGTRFDKVKEFNERYREDGVIWYLESFDLNSECLARGLWQLKEAGWFDMAKGFVFGRPCMYESAYGFSYQEAVMSVFERLHLPVIFDADIGHKAPQFSVVNGAIGTWKFRGTGGSLETKLK